jgi:hypothetical protein
MTLRKKKKILEIERGSTRSHPVEKSLWKRLRTCRKTEYRMNEDQCECQRVHYQSTGYRPIIRKKRAHAHVGLHALSVKPKTSGKKAE